MAKINLWRNRSENDKIWYLVLCINLDHTLALSRRDVTNWLVFEQQRGEARCEAAIGEKNLTLASEEKLGQVLGSVSGNSRFDEIFLTGLPPFPEGSHLPR